MTIVVTLELILNVMALLLIIRYGPVLVILWAGLCAMWVEQRFIDQLDREA